MLLELFEFKLLVIVPSPSNKPTKNCSMYDLSLILKLSISPALAPTCGAMQTSFAVLLSFSVLLLISLSWNAISREAFAKTTPDTKKNIH